jgi:hypothetical protein
VSRDLLAARAKGRDVHARGVRYDA